MAEVLITLGIIGIVATMTVPTLIQKQQDKAIVTKLKATYSIFSQAYNMAVQEYGTPDNWGFSSIDAQTPTDENPLQYDTENNRASSKIIFDIMTKYLKTTKTCGSNNKSECFDINNDNWKNVSSGVLSNGVSYYFFSRSGDCSLKHGNSLQLEHICGDLSVDLGLSNKKQKKWGRNLFRFYITKYGIIPKGLQAETAHSFERVCNSTDHEGCTAWAIYNENIDYMYCDDLSWDGKKKCK